MASFFQIKDNCLIWEYDGERMQIEPVRFNSLKFRCTKVPFALLNRDWTLIKQSVCKADIMIEDDIATIKNGKIICHISWNRIVRYVDNKGKTLLVERWRGSSGATSILISGRELKSISGTKKYKVVVYFEADGSEKLYGMGQHQELFLNLKGCKLELAQRNSQVNIPFVLSRLDYGFLWNNLAYGYAVFARIYIKWTAEVTDGIDYWITAGGTPAEIVGRYMQMTGLSPMMPEFVAGFWQSKLRYQTQNEFLEIAMEYKRSGSPLSVVFYESITREGITDVINLVRCAWIGSQRYGVAVWCGDIPSTFGALRIQVKTGLNMAISEILWWTTDIGGFSVGDLGDVYFRELIIPWFQYGTFCPIFRLRGFR